MAQRKTLTIRQVQVLRWIADGCPVGAMEGDGYRVSAAALRRHRFVRTSGRGEPWSAVITDAGRAYLAQVDGPNPPLPRQASVSVTEQLVKDVLAAGGSLRVPRSLPGRGGVDWGHRAGAAMRLGRVPAGKRLVVRDVSREECQVDLVDAPEGTTLALAPVPVPARVANYHPAVAAFRQRAGELALSRAALPRASRILQALVAEAERRGHGVETAAPTSPEEHRRWERGRASIGSVVLVVDGDRYPISVVEEGVKVSTEWSERAHRLRSRADETNATGRLKVSLPEAYTGRSASWADRRSWTVEEKLPEVLREVEVRAAEERHRRLEEERREAERRRAWEEAMVVARERHLEHHRAEILRDQMARWLEAGRIRSYCAAIQAAHPDSVPTLEWAAWALTFADRIDPLGHDLEVPPAPERFSPEELRPFLNGWSLYGP